MKYNWDKIINETYTKLFKASTPSVSFSKLLKEAVIDGEGRKHIPFEKYRILQKTEERIINNMIKKYKIKDFQKRAFRGSVILGCGPGYQD